MNVIDTVSRGKARTYMKTFTIDTDNNITVFATREEAAATTATPFDTFASQKELAELAAAWPPERLVAICAITFPNQRDYARTAIQSRSITAQERCIYTHTGWRRVDGSWIFLHAGGAIGGDGAVTDVSVRLFGPMSRYELPRPEGPEALLAAIRASLRLAELGPPSISFPLFAAACRAVFGEADFAIHLAGETGTFKSEIAALQQQHFGATMNRLHLPGAWSSTGNSLEALAFHAKDSLFVIDDFAPQGSHVDIARYHAAADRVFRAAGNHAGRGRLDSTTKLREPKPPRALILSTGEDIPRGQSIRARLLILELRKGDVTAEALTGCQEDAASGLYAQTMSGFLQWIAGDYDEIVAAFKQRCTELRMWASTRGGHARTPEIVASLQAGFDLFLEFSAQSRAVDGATRQRLSTRGWDALCAASDAQAKHLAASEPAARFVSLLRSCLSSGQAHLGSREGAAPAQSPQDCGWRGQGGNWTAQGHCVGWVDGPNAYIAPTAAYQVVQTACRAAGEALAVSEQMLKRLLRERGFLASTDQKRETLTVRRTICGSKSCIS
jgi:hypothetical protein